MYNAKIGSKVIIGTCSVVTHDIPDNSVVVGMPARVICSFDEYVEKMLKAEKYPDGMIPSHQRVSDELAAKMWERFIREHI